VGESNTGKLLNNIVGFDVVGGNGVIF